MSRPQRLTYDPGIIDGEPWAVPADPERGCGLLSLLLALVAAAAWWSQR